MVSKIWLINPFAMPPKYENRIQTLKRAQYLQKLGYDVTIIGGSFLHNTNVNLIQDNSPYVFREYNGIKYIHIKTTNYKKNSLKRMYNLIEFPIRLMLNYRKFERPDILVVLGTIPFGNMLYYLAKWLKVRFVLDIVDLWPESFVSVGLISKKNPLLQLGYLAEKWLYKRADDVVFTMEGGKDYIKEKGWDKDSGGPIDLSKIHYINNGVDLNDFEEHKSKYQIQDAVLQDHKLFKVIYLGSIRLNNDVKLLVDAARRLIEYPDIKFLIYGDGDQREPLEKYCKDNKISNVSFKEKWVEIKYVPYILSQSSLNILNYKPSSIWRFGGSQSKSFQYMASGKPICSNIKMGYCPINKYNLGVAESFESPTAYAEAILKFYKMSPKKYEEICKNNLDASRNYDYEFLTSRFESLVLNKYKY